MSELPHATETNVANIGPTQQAVKVQIYTAMIEDTSDNCQTLTIFTGVSQPSGVLHLAAHEEAPNTDPESIFVHAQDT